MLLNGRLKRLAFPTVEQRRSAERGVVGRWLSTRYLLASQLCPSGHKALGNCGDCEKATQAIHTLSELLIDEQLMLVQYGHRACEK